MSPTGEFSIKKGKEFNQASPIIPRTHFLKKPRHKQRLKEGETKLLGRLKMFLKVGLES